MRLAESTFVIGQKSKQCSRISGQRDMRSPDTLMAVDTGNFMALIELSVLFHLGVVVVAILVVVVEVELFVVVVVVVVIVVVGVVVLVARGPMVVVESVKNMKCRY